MSTNPRKHCREIMESLVPAPIWAKNIAFSKELKAMIEGHRLAKHDLLTKFEHAEFGIAAMQAVHLEFRYAFAQNFTDALIQAMVTAEQLEPRQGALGKVTARFLIQLNVLDELGFLPNSEAGSDYAGDPHNAHYVQFDNVLSDIGLTREQVQAYTPSAAAIKARRAVDGVRADHALLSVTLAVAETIFTRFAGPWAKSVSVSSEVDTSKGYHAIHVEHDGQFIDDNHSEDMWFVFRQVAEPDRYAEIRAHVASTLDAWAAFCDALCGQTV
ncbi:MAG TPA: hypothetical protein VFN67_04055 [Polyangiales bacterium]|nr:hypothetical protein [Polyangiales bacterium]